MSQNVFSAESAENMEAIEQQFAVKAVKQMDTYWNLLTAIPGSKLKLTNQDDKIYESFMKHFPEFKDPAKIAKIDEEEMKSKTGKERWRKFMKEFEDVADYNFGTMLRTDAGQEYTQEGTIFAVRMQFYAVEIARNKYGLNDWICQKK
ncbi:unnamed protein product [Ambrosiozyma monospora]|uniref:Unnamed protein product n=1 Tax=Ambrosiozyma monospora TaxID=43982 RepID=A0ACB5SSR0_AMBMO|nr:unnamed protein product [Ambrosiozyma monospora]